MSSQDERPFQGFLDLRFADIEYELWTLGEFLETLEKQLPTLVSLERWHRGGETERQDNDEEPNYAQLAAEDLFENVIPTLFRNPFVVCLWAAYESAVTGVARYLKETLGSQLSLSMLRGGFLDRAHTYFKAVLKVPLWSDTEEKDGLRALATVRNAIAHCNGVLESMSQEDRKKVRDVMRKDRGVLEKVGRVVVSGDFLRDTYQLVDRAVRGLLNRARLVSVEEPR